MRPARATSAMQRRLRRICSAERSRQRVARGSRPIQR
jgi:hypothetical protein